MRVQAVEHMIVGHGDDRRMIAAGEAFEPSDLGISDHEVKALGASGKIKPVVTAPSADAPVRRRRASSDLDEL